MPQHDFAHPSPHVLPHGQPPPASPTNTSPHLIQGTPINTSHQSQVKPIGIVVVIVVFLAGVWLIRRWFKRRSNKAAGVAAQAVAGTPATNPPSESPQYENGFVPNGPWDSQPTGKMAQPTDAATEAGTLVGEVSNFQAIAIPQSAAQNWRFEIRSLSGLGAATQTWPVELDNVSAGQLVNGHRVTARGKFDGRGVYVASSVENHTSRSTIVSVRPPGLGNFFKGTLLFVFVMVPFFFGAIALFIWIVVSLAKNVK
jgi:hypothetical protein